MPDPADPARQIPSDTYATVQLGPDGKPTVALSFWCPGAATPLPDAGAIRDQVVKLLPVVPVGIVTGHLSLVNIQEIVWTPTPVTTDLGRITVVGTPVHIRLTFDHTTWDYGDGSPVETSTVPGKAYNPKLPCATKQCPDYLGHTYTSTGPMTIRMTPTWTGQYSLDDTTWTTITGGPLTGQTATADITLKQARAVLVPTN